MITFFSLQYAHLQAQVGRAPSPQKRFDRGDPGNKARPTSKKELESRARLEKLVADKDKDSFKRRGSGH